MSMFKKKSKSLEIFFVLISFIVLFFLLALIFSNFFLFWAGQEYQNIGSMLSGVFGSAAAFAGSIVAIALAWIALKISYKQAFLEDEKVIDCFILDRINPALKNISEFFIHLKQFRYLVRSIDDEDRGLNDDYLELFKSRSNNIVESLKKLFSDKITFVYIESIYDRDKIKEFNDKLKEINEIYKNQEPPQYDNIQNFVKAQVEYFDNLHLSVLANVEELANKKKQIQNHRYYYLFNIFAEGFEHLKKDNKKFTKEESLDPEKTFFELTKKLIKDTFPENMIITNESLLNQKIKSLLYIPVY